MTRQELNSELAEAISLDIASALKHDTPSECHIAILRGVRISVKSRNACALERGVRKVHWAHRSKALMRKYLDERGK